MPDNPNPVVNLPPLVLRRKEGMKLAGVGATEFQARINAGRYRSFLDGGCRFVVAQSIIDDQKRLMEEQEKTPAKPLGRGSGRRGRPRKKPD